MRPSVVVASRRSLLPAYRRPIVLLATSAIAATAVLLLTSRAPAISIPSTSTTLSSSKMSTSTTAPPREAAAPKQKSGFTSIDYEIFGKVQGVWFRQSTTTKADEINKNGKKLVGFVRNTEHGSVEGVAQGEPEAIAEFEHFVTRVGSPLSRIDRFEVKNRREIDELEFERFERRY